MSGLRFKPSWKPCSGTSRRCRGSGQVPYRSRRRCVCPRVPGVYGSARSAFLWVGNKVLRHGRAGCRPGGRYRRPSVLHSLHGGIQSRGCHSAFPFPRFAEPIAKRHLSASVFRSRLSVLSLRRRRRRLHSRLPCSSQGEGKQPSLSCERSSSPAVLRTDNPCDLGGSCRCCERRPAPSQLKSLSPAWPAAPETATVSVCLSVRFGEYFTRPTVR